MGGNRFSPDGGTSRTPLSPHGQTGSLLTVRRVRHAVQTPRPGGLEGRTPPSSFIIQGESHLPALDVTPRADKKREKKKKKTGLPHFFLFFFFE